MFSVNSPFLFALVDDASLVPLFMGIVTNPAPDNDRMSNDEPLVNGTRSDQPVIVDSKDSKNLLTERAACSTTAENVNMDWKSNKDNETCPKLDAMIKFYFYSNVQCVLSVLKVSGDIEVCVVYLCC